MPNATIIHGDAQHLPLADCSVDAIVCDPPYGIGFMGKEWDSGKSFVERKADKRNTFDHVGGNHNPSNSADAARTRRVEGQRFQVWCEEWAAEALRVLKPGGFLLAFGGTRTWHRLACAIEDAGFELRDSLAWHYGSGFPKSLNVSKDARFCQRDQVECGYGNGHLLGVRQDVRDASGVAETGEVADLFQTVQRESSWSGLGNARPQGFSGVAPEASAEAWRGQPGMEGRGDVQAAEGQLHRPEVRALPGGPAGDGAGGRVRDGAPARDGALGRSAAAPDGVREPHRPEPAQQRPVQSGAVPVERGPQAGRGWPLCGGCGKPVVPAGLGTALKPSFEPVVVARRPLQGTVAANVLQWGCGALNVDGCRIAHNEPEKRTTRTVGKFAGTAYAKDTYSVNMDGGTLASANAAGRWPTNVVLSHVGLTDGDGDIIGDACDPVCVPHCPVAELDAHSGVTRSVADKGTTNRQGDPDWRMTQGNGYADTGTASRFFPVFRYQAKAPSRERPKVNGVSHPTVKPLTLMKWLARLTCPPGGTILDMFAGSGATLEAALLEGFNAIGVERSAEYLPLIQQRIDRATAATQPAPDDVAELTLFDVA